MDEKKENYEPKLRNIDLFGCSDKELIQFGHQAINHHISDIVAPEMMRRMKKAMVEFNKNSSKQTNKMITLTYWIMGLTVALGFLALIQVYILLK